MGRQTEPVEFDASKLQAISSRLEQVAARIRAIATLLEGEKIFIYNAPSMRLGLNNLTSFAEQAETSFDAFQLGDPILPKAKQPNSNPKKSKE